VSLLRLARGLFIFKGPKRLPAACVVALALMMGLAGQASAAPRASIGPEPVALVVVDSCKGVADGALCTDRNSCTVKDSCLNGICLGTVVADGTPCTDDNQCTANDLCQSGVCVGSPVADNTPCTDGEVCTDPDLCRSGVCMPGPTLQCDDGDPCTTDTCVLGDGCHYDPLVVCPDGGVDAMPDDASPPDLPPDTGGEDVLDDGSVDLPKIYEARGGACVCSTAAAPRSATARGMLVAVLVLSRRRKRGG